MSRLAGGSPHVEVFWKEESEPATMPSGHGIGLYDSMKELDLGPIAFVDGFEWFHGQSEHVSVYCVSPDAVTTPDVLTEMKRALEPYLLARKIPPDRLTTRIRVLVNG